MGKKKIQSASSAEDLPRTKFVTKKAKNQKNQKNIFSLKKFQTEKLIIAEFPLITIQNKKKAYCVPKFRLDKLAFTPGFSLPDQFNRSYIKTQKIIQQCRISAQTTQIDVSQMESPRPSQRTSYCTICKVKFQDYFLHISEDEHISRMKGSYYNRFINELCDKFKIQRFFKGSQSISQQTQKQEQRPSCSHKLFLQQQFGPLNKKLVDLTKQMLYQKIRQEFRMENKEKVNDIHTASLQIQRQLQRQNIFDVLQF